MAADDRDAAHRRRQRQDVIVVLEQDAPSSASGAGHRGVRGHVDRAAGAPDDRPAPCANIERRMRRAMSSSRACGTWPLATASSQRLAEKGLLVERIARILVEPGIGGGDGAVGRAPVGHHIALPAPVALAAPRSAGTDSRRHAGRRPGCRRTSPSRDCRVSMRDLEGEQVGHARRVAIDRDVQPVAPGLLVVQRIMLDRRDDVVGLDAGDRVRRPSCRRAGGPRRHIRNCGRCAARAPGRRRRRASR